MTEHAKPEDLKLQEFRVEDYLDTVEQMAAYLSVWLEDPECDAAMLADALNTVTLAMNMSRKELAEKAGLSRGGLYRVISKDSNPSVGTLMQLLRAMGMQLKVVPVDAGSSPA